MFTDRGAALVVVAATLVTLGVVLNVWVAAAAALPIVLVLAASAVVFILVDPAPTVERAIEPSRALVNDAPQVTLRVRGHGVLGALEILDAPPPGLELTGGMNAATLRAPSSGVTLSYALRCRIRGHFHVADLRWRWTSPFGVFAREGVVTTATELVVIPKWEEGEFGTLKPAKRMAIGLIQVAAAGQGSSYYGIREYVAGDPYRSINWKATARAGKPLVNEYEREVPSDVVLLLDARAGARAGDAAENPLETSIRSIASLTHHFILEGSRVGLVILSARPRYLHPDRGSRQLDRILEELLDVQAEGDMPLAHLVAVVPPEAKATGILFANVTRDSSLPDACHLLEARYRRSVVICPVFRHEPGAGEASEVAKEAIPAAERVRGLEIEALRDAFAHAGVPAIVWDVRESLGPALEEVSLSWST